MSYIQNELKITINTSIPGFQTIKYNPSMTLKDAKNISSLYFNPLVKLDKSVIEKVPENLRIKEFFNQGLFESLINAHGMVYEKTLKEATKKGYIDNNISVTLDTIFPVNSIIYINAEPYVIADVQWRKGAWKVSTPLTPPSTPSSTTPSSTTPSSTTPSTTQTPLTNRSILLENDIPTPDPALTIQVNSTTELRNYFQNNTYYELINAFFEFTNNEDDKGLINIIQQNTSNTIIPPNSIDLYKINESVYNKSVETLSVMYNTGGGDCFFLAVAQGLNYNNFHNFNNKIYSSDNHGKGNKIFTQQYLRNQVYEYLTDLNHSTDLNDNFATAQENVNKLNDLFLQQLLDRQYNWNSNKLSDEYYITLLNHIYTSSDNFLISKPTNPPRIEEEYEKPFTLINESNLQKYILSSDYWANEKTINALCNKLKINIIIIKNEKNKMSTYTFDLNTSNRYLFLYNKNDHYELIIFKYTILIKNITTTRYISLFDRNNINLPPPLYILFLLYGSKYIYIEPSTYQWTIFPTIFKILNNSFQNIKQYNNNNTILQQLYEYFPYIKRLIPDENQINNPNDDDLVINPLRVGGAINNYNPNNYNPNNYNPNNYNPNNYNPINYNPNNYNPNNYNYNPNNYNRINYNRNNYNRNYFNPQYHAKNYNSFTKTVYYISIDMELKKGTSLSPEELHNSKCNRKWNSVRKAFADFTGKKYVILPVYSNKTQKQSQKTSKNNTNTKTQHIGKRSKTYKKNTHG